jgi:hypothetical protein
MNTHDDELRARFQSLRGEREALAGSFRTPHASGRVRRRHPLLLATAAIPALIAVFVYASYFSSSARERRVVRAVAEMMAWRSPTDTLLYNAYAEWFATTPTFITDVPTTGDNP